MRHRNSANIISCILGYERRYIALLWPLHTLDFLCGCIIKKGVFMMNSQRNIHEKRHVNSWVQIYHKKCLETHDQVDRAIDLRFKDIELDTLS